MQGDESQEGTGQPGQMPQQGQQSQEQEEGQPCDWRAPVGDGEMAQAADQPNPDAVRAAKEKETCDPPADWRSPGG